jgi:dGTPase
MQASPFDFEAEALLAPYAARSSQSRGRRYREPESVTRTAFARDRDRIIHCSAFRRLEYKTQVFVNHEGDLFRTRLTHSLEVAQIARVIARNLHANEDLVEAIALAHDLGHAPFGHVGQDVLNACMREHGGFEHNLHSLTIVDELEKRYGSFDGLNLCFETREGILKHCTHIRAKQLGDVGLRFLTGQQPSLEAQIVNYADEIAYNHHDIDDGLRAGLLSFEQLEELDAWQEHRAITQCAYPKLKDRRLVYETIRRMLDTFIIDLIETTRTRLQQHAPDSPDAVRAISIPLVAYSNLRTEHVHAIKRFLFRNLYRHERLKRMADEARQVLSGLFEVFSQTPQALPLAYQSNDLEVQPKRIAHYIAGMTDRYAIKEYQRLAKLKA